MAAPMSITVIVELNLKADKLDEFELMCQGLLPQTRRRPGNLGVQVKQDQDDPARIIMIETWRTRADYEGYNAWRQDRGDFTVLAGMVTDTPTRRFLDHVPV
ncbi:hypothetical protein GFB49_01580 [Epibacterium sp. SM1979]|uniref:ABM domain-containing protein n=2 Tax=Tritonibacter litoralis TaxID=2662264 RepID=A0A843YBT8_9RHOB|nr:hypothetical protein [Tritonibacter litoralis]